MTIAGWVVTSRQVKITGEDRRLYDAKLRRSLDALARMLRERSFAAGPSRVGLEIELHLVGGQTAPSMSNEQVLAAIPDPAWETELGQFNLEVNVPARELSGDALDGLERQVLASFKAADAKARGAGSRLVMIGILPTLGEQHMGERSLSANERYRVLNEQILAARGEDMRIEIDGAERLLTHAGSITPEAACTSVQLHVQVAPDDFARYWNAAQAVAGPQVAVAANSPYLFGPAALAGDPDHPVPAGHRHPPGATATSGGAAPGVVRRALDHLRLRFVRRERRVLPGPAAGL